MGRLLFVIIPCDLGFREEVMSVCDDLLAKLFCSKAGESVMQSLLRVGGRTQHLVVSYQLGAKVQENITSNLEDKPSFITF